MHRLHVHTTVHMYRRSNPCEACNRTFRSQACFDKHKTNKLKGKTVCAQKRNCAKCNGLLGDRSKHECLKSFRDNCQKSREYGHLCYMAPLVNKLSKSDNVLFVFYNFETTQDTRISDSTTLHVPNLVCLQQFRSQCEMQADIDTDCERCGRRRHSLWEDPVGDLLSHLCEPRPWCERVIAIAHNERGFDAQFILDSAFVQKWTPKLILNGKKIISMTIHLVKIFRFNLVSAHGATQATRSIRTLGN